MDFALSDRTEELRGRLADFIAERVDPAEAVHAEQVTASGDPHFHPPVMEDLKAEARARGLWNLFLPERDYGPGLTNLEYAPLCELMGQSPLSQEATNCSAPDTGNMEALVKFATPLQVEQFLRPLLEGETRSCFAMTEPWVASSDATNITSRITRDGDHYVVNAHKWWTSGAASSRCSFAILMGVSDPDADRHRRHSMVIVPFDTPGVSVVRSLPVFGHDAGGGHCETLFEDVRIPKEYLLGEEGGGFAIAQARLGPGRIHHCMRAIGMAEKALRLMCERTQQRVAFGKPIADQGTIQAQIAESRIEIEQARLLTMKAAWLMDTVGAKGARFEIAAIKVVAARLATTVIDRAIQAFGAAGVSDDWPLASMYTHARTLHLVDGPDEVHLQQIARRELRGYESFRGVEHVKVRIGYGIGTQGLADGGARFGELIDALESLGFDSIWCSERATGPIPEPMVSLAFAAGRTKKLKLGTSVQVLPGRNPVLLAKQWASLDVLAGGRALPAFGLGVVEPHEQQAFGVTREERAPWFDEALPLLRRLWTEDVVDHDGPRFHYEGVSIGTRPVQQPPDVWLGGRARRELRRVGELADGWLPSFCTPAQVAEGRGAVEEAAAAAGREIDDEHYGAMVFYGRTEVPEPYASIVGARLGFDPGEVIAVGLPALRERLEEFLAVGFSKLVLVPVQEAESWQAEVEELAEGLLDLQGTRSFTR